MPGAAASGAKVLATPAFWAALSIALAVGIGVASNASLDVPPEIDHYRDMGAAQALLNGRFGEDAAFRGETAWYPPLLPALMALASVVTSKPMPWVYVHVGPLLNAAAPVAFYILARHLAGRWTAVFSLVAFLFLANPRAHTWMSASYSPWAWPVLFAQALFFLALRAWLVATEKQDSVTCVTAGALIGLTFLAHPAPALLLVSITIVTTGFRAWNAPRELRAAPLRVLVTSGMAAALVCFPFLWPLIAEYGLVIQNAVPSRYGGVWGIDFILAHTSLRTVGAVAGGVWLLSRPTPRPAWRIAVATGLTVAFSGVVYGMITQKLQPRGVVLPMLFPTFHFLFYLHALEASLFGPGLAWLLNRTHAGERLRTLLPTSWQPMLAQLGLAVLVACALPSYLARDDYTKWPDESRRFARDERLTALYGWAKANLEPDDVVLATARTGMFSIVAAGHAIVFAHPSMMNPYVALAPREQARDAMFESLKAGDVDRFRAEARKLGVTYVIVETSTEPELSEPCCEMDPATIRGLPARFSTVEATVYAVPND